jgi:hypothetical protein
MGISVIPTEDEVLAAMTKCISEPGFYFFPGKDMGKKLSDAEQKAWEAKYQKGPSGILVVQPNGAEVMAPRQLLIELATNIGAALIAALILTQVKAGYAGRVLVVVAMALFGFLSISASYWNWYGFPTQFEIGEATDQLGGWLLGGLALAAIVRPVSQADKPRQS